MANDDFKFVESYRRLVPTAAREVVEARQKGHEKLFPLVKTMDKYYDLCRLAFRLPQDSASLTEWFEKTTKEFDPQFSVDIDKAEAGRIASLLLRELISRGIAHAAFAVLVSSFCGQRVPVDGALLIAARDALANAARQRRIVVAEKKIAGPAATDLKGKLDAIQQSFAQETVRAGLDAVAVDLRAGVTKLAASANDAHQSLRDDVIRLAEEVDMLWWHIGDWSEALQRPRSDLPTATLAVVAGIELGNFVRSLPGPYGAYGVLRRSLGRADDHKTRLTQVITSIGYGDVKKLAHDLPRSAMTIFPVHAAMWLAAERGDDSWLTAFNQIANDLENSEVGEFDLAVQAFRERVLIKYGGLAR